MDLHSAGHRRGVVAAPHHAAAAAGRAILAEGGNALEAMVAMAAAIAAVYPHMNHLGGDGFWLLREPSGRVRALLAAGRAGAGARRELYREYESIPPRGPLAALTVPGADRRLDARARGRAGARRAPAARRASGAGDPACGRGLRGYAQPGAAHGRKARRAARGAGVRRRPSSSRASRRKPASSSSSRRSPPPSTIWRMPGSTISIAAMSDARSRPISSASAAR